MRRRAFLLGGVAVALAGSGGLVLMRGRGRAPAASTAEPASPEPVFPPEDGPLLLAIADVIVPREGDLPAASEIGILPRLERWARLSPSRLRTYQEGWPRLRKRLEDVGAVDPSDLPEKPFRMLYRRYRFASRPPREAFFFEQLRRDVLRLYYSSPEGWASVSYTGPVRRPHPLGDA